MSKLLDGVLIELRQQAINYEEALRKLAEITEKEMKGGKVPDRIKTPSQRTLFLMHLPGCILQGA